MGQVDWFTGKYLAAHALLRMMRWLKNWPEVWSAYRHGFPLPPFRFRRGFTLHHNRGDEPLILLYEIFVEGCYSQGKIKEGVIIDLGANIGAATLSWASHSSKVTIHAYEPNPATNQTLRHNIEANNLSERVTIYNDAVGREVGEIQLWAGMPSLLTTSYGEAPPASNGIAINVPMVDLNEVLRRAGGEKVSLLKIDTEGAEADILEGASLPCLKSIRRIVLEYHDSLCPGAYARCKQILDQAGFRVQNSPLNANQGLLYAWRD
jgi:FkbM family methyltransferase